MTERLSMQSVCICQSQSPDLSCPLPRCCPYICSVLLSILNYGLLVVQASVSAISNVSVEEDETTSYLCKACSSEEYLMFSHASVGSDGLILTSTNCVTGKAPLLSKFQVPHL